MTPRMWIFAGMAVVVVLAICVWILIRAVDDVDDEPVEIEPPSDDRWGEHAAVEDRKL